MNEQEPDHRICFIGDSFVLGTGDPECLGWVGRVTTATLQSGWNLTAYNLGVRRDTSREILKRWEQECLYRFPPSTQNYVIFSFGVNDVMFEEGSTRIQTTESSENFKRILEKSQLSYHPYVIGPPPVADFLHNARIRELSLNFAQISLAMHVPYLSVVESLLNNSIWMQDVNQCDGAHPGRKGYEQITALVHGWKEWPFLQPV